MPLCQVTAEGPAFGAIAVGETNMVNNCANPQCNKPLHYLRDGRIFVFDVPGDILGPEGKRARHLEHYWLCGDCSPSLQLEHHSTEGIQVLARSRVHAYRDNTLPPALAS